MIFSFNNTGLITHRFDQNINYNYISRFNFCSSLYPCTPGFTEVTFCNFTSTCQSWQLLNQHPKCLTSFKSYCWPLILIQSMSSLHDKTWNNHETLKLHSTYPDSSHLYYHLSSTKRIVIWGRGTLGNLNTSVHLNRHNIVPFNQIKMCFS